MLSYRSLDEHKTLTVCPYCQRPLGAVRYGVSWTPLQARILDALKGGPNEGYTARELAGIIYHDQDKWVRISDQMHRIRKRMKGSGWEIARRYVGRHGKWYVLRRRK